MEEQDIRRLAAQLIRMFDDGAEMAAAMYADRAIAAGNMQASNKWNLVTATIQSLRNPRGQKAAH